MFVLFAAAVPLGIATNAIAAWLPARPQWLRSWHVTLLTGFIALLTGLIGVVQTATAARIADQPPTAAPVAPSLGGPSPATGSTSRDSGTGSGDEPSSAAADPCRQSPTIPADLPRTRRYVLKESNTPFTNANDKVDFDTGEPGHGPQLQGSWNPARDGRLADLVLEHSELHTGCRSPLMLRAGQDSRSIDISKCRELLTAGARDLTSSILLSDVAQGDMICMRTDEGLVVLIEVIQLVTSYPTTLTIDTTVSKP